MHLAAVWPVVIAAAFLWAGDAAAQRPVYAPGAAAQAKPLSPAQRAERRFLQLAAANLRLQAEASQMVATRSNNTAVKELAQTLMARQKTAQPELLHLLQARGMAMPLPGNDHGKVLKQLGKLTGAKFDRLYVDEVVIRSYQADIANFEKIAPQAEDPVLKAWVDRQLPTLRFHLSRASRALPAQRGVGL